MERGGKLGLNATTPELVPASICKPTQTKPNQTPRPTSPFHVAIVKGPLRSTSKAGIDVERCALPWCASVGDMSPEALEAERSKHLPACRRCRVRKIKCNRGAPKCANCTSSNAACIIWIPSPRSSTRATTFASSRRESASCAQILTPRLRTPRRHPWPLWSLWSLWRRTRTRLTALPRLSPHIGIAPLSETAAG